MNLIEAIRSEAAIWKTVYQFDESIVPGWTVFWEPEYPTQANCNILYPTSENPVVIGKVYEERLRLHYGQFGIKPHVLDISGKSEAFAVIKSQYFGFQRDPVSEPPRTELEIIETDDLDNFSNTLKTAYSLPNVFIEYFKKRMSKIRDGISSSFYLAQHGRDICGCWTIFRTGDGVDFLMNFALLPDYNNLSTQIMNAILLKGRKTIYTSANLPILAETLLPQAGFKHLGTAVVSDLDDYLK